MQSIYNHEAPEARFLPFIFLALSSISFMRFLTRQIVLLKFAYLFLLKSMLRMLARLVSFFYSMSVGLIILLISSCDEKEAEEESLERRCSD